MLLFLFLIANFKSGYIGFPRYVTTASVTTASVTTASVATASVRTASRVSAQAIPVHEQIGS